MESTILYLDSSDERAKQLTVKASNLLQTFETQTLTVGEIDWVLSKAKKLLAFSTFQGTSLPEDLQTR